ncbi:hypothetical protein HIM_12320 [Hirsutella minnesotensis 3608]|uniref:HAT C-terminal dimerisation domain-containing protein n=1 Tax=Hirsutella minnesotensis 3608 TaxID=1043627 RepID=A0A0F7ZF03_9HYPO|nr:hypothetical protein HIM_12320 [Hirsutella minnesotensis 3608]
MDSFSSHTPSDCQSSIAAVIERNTEVYDRLRSPAAGSGTPVASKRKRVTTADATWEHTRRPQESEPLRAGPKNNLVFYCKYCCNPPYSTYVSTTFRSHLLKIHSVEAASSEPNSTKKACTNLLRDAFNKAGEVELTRLQAREEQALRSALNSKAAMEALVQLVTVRNLPYNCNTWPELHALLMAANYTAEGLINTSHGHIQKLCTNSYAIHKDILRKRLQSSPTKVHLSADVWSAPNHKSFLGICVQFLQEGMVNPCQALLALPELPGIDGPGSHSGAEQWKLLQPVIEDYDIMGQLGYITGDNHGPNDVLCRLLSRFLEERGIAWNSKHRRIRCHGHVVNLCVQAFLFMDSKEAVLEACRQMEEMDHASFNIDMMQGWKKRKERGWSQMGPLGKLHNIAIHIRANDCRYKLFRQRAGRVLGLDNDTRWNSWFLMLDTALDKEEHVKWYQDKYYDALENDYLAPQDWQNLREIRNFLQPFWKITLLTEGFRSTLDRTLFTMDVLHKHYQQAFNKYTMNQQLLGPVLTSWYVFDKYYQLSDESPAYGAALILHPSRGKAYIQKNWPKTWHKKTLTGVMKLWEDEYKNLATVHTSPSIVPALEQDEYDLLAQELNVIGTESDVDEYGAYTSQSPVPIDCSALAWWLRDEQQERFPRLSKMATDILHTRHVCRPRTYIFRSTAYDFMGSNAPWSTDD